MDKAVSVSPPTVEARSRARSHRLMHLLMLLATFCWAGNVVAVKEALDGFTPLALTMLRIGGAAGVFAGLFWGWRGRPAIRLTAREWFVMALVAMTGVTFNQLFFIAGLARSSVAHAGLIVALGPVMVLVISCLLRLEALTVLKFAGMLISFGGVAVLTTGKVGQGGGGHWIGDMILLAGSGVFAGYTILMKEIANKYHVLTLNVAAYAIGSLAMVPFGASAVASARWDSVPPHAWVGLVYAILFGSVVPYLSLSIAINELTASRVAAFSYIQPVISTGLGAWLLAEKISAKIILGGTLILLGVYLTERERGEEQ
ncbi:MAG: DMT family transporter [Terriglobia bacterium]